MTTSSKARHGTEYGAKHQAERRRIQRLMDKGQLFPCSRHAESYCPGTPVDPTNWELDHTDDRTGWLGPAHPPCNAYAGRVEKASSGMIIREWDA